MPHSIRSVAILGAGTMGAQIAAHFANAGVPSLLLDLTEAVAREGLSRARRRKPDPFFTAQSGLIETGGFDRDLARLATADWILEAIVERMDVKKAVLEQVDAARRPGTIVSSNTSSLSISALSVGRTADLRRHWLGTHFFNPPRYLHLLEVIPTQDTDPLVLERVSRFADLRLGKGVVVAKDTPGFIANHIGVFSLIQALRALESGDYTIDEIDAITGPSIGRPKSATFRTADIAGLDILRHVAGDMAERWRQGGSAGDFRLPGFVDALVERGWIGEKAGRGFYTRHESEILTLDPSTLTYRPRQQPDLPALDRVRNIGNPADRMKTLFQSSDRVGAFIRRALGTTLLYAAEVAPLIAHSIDDVDRAMRWGFGWELGPFEIWDAIGIREVLDAVGDKAHAPSLASTALQAGQNRFRERGLPPAAPDLQILRSARDRQRVIRRNPGASLIDLGDGVLAVELHAKMNVIGGDTIDMLQAAVKEAAANFQALIVGTEAPNFSAGANLTLLLLEAQEGNWHEIDDMVRRFQKTMLALRYADVPVVACPAGLALGGGCEMALHVDRVQAGGELYIGLVEVGLGLIPAGGGTKEMLRRAVGGLPASADLLPFVQRVFETIGLAKVSTSAEDARRLGYLTPSDGITLNAERLAADGKALALERVREGYRAPERPTAIPVGGDGLRAALNLGVHLAWRSGRITEYDALVGRALASVLAGGKLPHATTVTEQYLLDLEREMFLTLCGERKTLERIQHTLRTGKPLRN